MIFRIASSLRSSAMTPHLCDYLPETPGRIKRRGSLRSRLSREKQSPSIILRLLNLPVEELTKKVYFPSFYLLIYIILLLLYPRKRLMNTVYKYYISFYFYFYFKNS